MMVSRSCAFVLRGRPFRFETAGVFGCGLICELELFMISLMVGVSDWWVGMHPESAVTIRSVVGGVL